jgi:hypothetical protein
MGLKYKNLDEKTRNFMLEEINQDITNNALYMSPRLTEAGRTKYPELLKTAAVSGDDDQLSLQLRFLFNANEERRNKNGTVTLSKVPSNAHETLAEGEFNRFYIRALCRRAIDEKVQLMIYRAKTVVNPRPESQKKIGQIVDAQSLLIDLSKN